MIHRIRVVAVFFLNWVVAELAILAAPLPTNGRDKIIAAGLLAIATLAMWVPAVIARRGRILEGCNKKTMKFACFQAPLLAAMFGVFLLLVNVRTTVEGGFQMMGWVMLIGNGAMFLIGFLIWRKLPEDGVCE